MLVDGRVGRSSLPLPWVRLLPAPRRRCAQGHLPRRGWWAAPLAVTRPPPAPSAGAAPPPSPPPAEPGLPSWAECWSLKNHSAKLGPCLSINSTADSGYSCLRGERSLGTIFAVKGNPTVHPRCSRCLLGRWQKPPGKVVRGGPQRLQVGLAGAEGVVWGSEIGRASCRERVSSPV